MHVIGIDPAPVKDTVVFDGEKFECVKNEELKDYLKTLRDDSLICWDAPLTGKSSESNFYTRKIEKIINQNNKPPKGISTLGYAGCPHWTITQYCLGLPLMWDGYNLESLPYKLIRENILPDDQKKHVVEVHPALAIWCWLQHNKDIQNWNYKKDEKVFKNIIDKLKLQLPKDLSPHLNDMHNLDDLKKQCPKTEIKPDDKLDAFIAWYLGVIWLKDQSKVNLIGTYETGCMLLPKTTWSDELGKLLQQ